MALMEIPDQYLEIRKLGLLNNFASRAAVPLPVPVRSVATHQVCHRAQSTAPPARLPYPLTLTAFHYRPHMPRMRLRYSAFAGTAPSWRWCVAGRALTRLRRRARLTPLFRCFRRHMTHHIHRSLHSPPWRASIAWGRTTRHRRARGNRRWRRHLRRWQHCSATRRSLRVAQPHRSRSLWGSTFRLSRCPP